MRDWELVKRHVDVGWAGARSPGDKLGMCLQGLSIIWANWLRRIIIQKQNKQTPSRTRSIKYLQNICINSLRIAYIIFAYTYQPSLKSSQIHPTFHSHLTLCPYFLKTHKVYFMLHTYFSPMQNHGTRWDWNTVRARSGGQWQESRAF